MTANSLVSESDHHGTWPGASSGSSSIVASACVCLPRQGASRPSGLVDLDGAVVVTMITLGRVDGRWKLLSARVRRLRRP